MFKTDSLELGGGEFRLMKRMFKLISITAFLLSLVSCGGGSSDNSKVSHLSEEGKVMVRNSMIEVFRLFDEDSDGFISREEGARVFTHKFDLNDKDDDGVMEQEDYDNDTKTHFIMPYDKDDDGVTTSQEYFAHYREIFEKIMDEDGSGNISEDEFINSFEVF